ncbi:MAG TPA: TonB-dependent receptor [Bryobacteraceae bacterium]|nr:TonB-dependent receptor [Bryobacteraceae bacterium]
MRLSNLAQRVFTLLTLCAASAIVASAQFESATVLGTVTDPSNAPVSGASVTLTNVRTGVSVKTQTDSSGNYLFVNQRLATYRIHVEMNGFKAEDTEAFDLAVDSRQRVNIKLVIGAVSESIIVSDAAGLLEADNSSRGQVINSGEIAGLPLNGRAYADLTLLVPGVAKSLLQNGTDSSRDASYNVNGQRSELNNFMLDGVDNNAYGTSNQGFSNQVMQPSPDAIQQFKVETNNFSAEYDHAAGAVINVTIKSGTNQVHGSLWAYNRNTVLNAVGFFKPLNGTLPFNQNQFGAAVGGPILKNKLFLFGDYEGFRRVYHPLQFASVPTVAMDHGDFSAYGLPIANPLTGDVAPNGIIPPSQFSPIANALTYLPAPNLPGLSNNYESSPSDMIYNDKGDIRSDYYLNSKIIIFGRYSQLNTRIFSPPNIPGPSGGNANGNVYVQTYEGVGGVTWSINPSSILEFRLGANYSHNGKLPSTVGQPTSGFTIPNQPLDPSFAGGLITSSVSGFSQFGRQGSNPQYQYPLVYDPKVNYTKIIGRHSLKFGFEYQHIDTDVSDFNPKYGQLSFSGYFSDPCYATNPSCVNGLSSTAKAVYALADYLYGAPSNYTLNNNPVAHYRQRMYFGYVQDDFKVNSKLTLNLGLRYEFTTPQYTSDNKLANFNPQNNSLIFASNGSLYNRALVHPDPNNWAPRVGLAYQVRPKTVIRSAYGISWVLFNRAGGENLLAYNGPFIINSSINQLPSQGICTSAAAPAGTCFRSAAQGFPNGFIDPSNFSTAISQVRYIPGSNRNGYIQSWHFTIQQELAKDLLLDVAYVGNHSVGLNILSDANQALPNQQGQNLNLLARRPIQGFTDMEIAYDGGFGSYEGLQVKLEKKNSNGLYFLNSFTWSKAIDNAPGHLENYNGDNSRINYYNTKIERGLSSYNQPLNDTLSVLYDLPVGRGRHFNIDNKALDYVVGGWSVNMINTMTSGLPINVGYSASSQQQISNLVSERPNLVPGQPLYLSTGNPIYYLNPAAYSVPNYTQPFGNTPRNNVKTPFLFGTDLGLHKNFPITEARYFQFRAEAFNLLNKTNFATVGGTNANSSGFGVFNATFPARQIQLALKLVF